MIGRSALYWRYATRALRRGGQRSLLAVLCIAVGVMAVVALRLAGDMIDLSITSNVRGALGGDLTLSSSALPLSDADLERFNELKQRGVISDYLAVGLENATLRREGGRIDRFTLYVVDDPKRYPLAGDSGVSAPAGATLADLLAKPGSIVLSEFVAQQAQLQIGGVAHLNLLRGGSQDVSVAGTVSNQAVVNGATRGFIARDTYTQMTSRPERYGLVQVSAPDSSHAAQAATTLRREFPAASVQTVQEAIDQSTTISMYVNRFLIIVGLLALLIGGIGIVHTMQVGLSRRRIEIAMLKTCGYRRRDLYALFAVEAALLGLAGGVVGTAVGVGLSALVRSLIERVVPISIVFHISATAILSGILIGVATALIFGLLPIVRAAAIRPLAVLRDLVAVPTVGSAAQSVLLYVLLVVLFTALSESLIGSLTVTVIVVVATLASLLVLAGIFALIVAVVGRLPVPERASLGFIGLVTAATAGAVLVARWSPPVGAALLVATLSGYVVVFLPRRAKTAIRLALRAIGRSKARTSASLVALFVGVYTIGLILVLGQDISAKINESLNTLNGFNVFALASSDDSGTVRSVTATLPGLQERSITDDVSVTPTEINGIPLSQVLGIANPEQSRIGGQFRLSALAGLEGYDIAGGQLPDVSLSRGRSLDRSDAGSANVILRNDLRDNIPGLRVGSTVTVTQATTHASATLHVVGFYQPIRRTGTGIRFNTFFQPILADRHLVDDVAGRELQTVVSMKLDPAQKTDALRQLERVAPGVVIIDLADLAATVTQYLSNAVVLLVALASLALFAGIVIIANTVALAMLERRREMGILKAVGHSSRSVLSQVIVENGVIAGIGAVAGMAAVTLATSLLGTYVLQTDLGVATPIVVAVIVGIVALVTATAAAVAWGPTRVRPIEVLRYE
jgi:predicted lysophospholipase L1 biosynthesis ABC-type transport system permease subunit